MTEKKRFTTDNGSNEDVCLVDNITKKEYESNFENIVDLMNKTWEQTLRFEKHNQELVQRSIKYEDKIDELKNENKQLKSIKNFAERNGINIFKIDEAFRKCWADNSKLTEENNALRKENEQLKCYYDTLKLQDDDRKEYCKELKEEIKQLKQIIKEAYEQERTTLGKNTLRNLLLNLGVDDL